MNSRLAIDIGNSRVKLGLFTEPEGRGTLPKCIDRIALPIGDSDLVERFQAWLISCKTPRETWIGSVNPPLLAKLLDHWPAELESPRVADRSSTILPANQTRFPERVGTDRLFNAAAANRLRRPDQPAIIIDSGTATKVDLVDAAGAFRGGAILAGFELIANALHERTAQLPRIDMADLAVAPNPVGNDTESALRSGLYWGLVGAVRELTTRITDSLNTVPLILMTGGAGLLLARHFPNAVHEENLTLHGILSAARERIVE